MRIASVLFRRVASERACSDGYKVGVTALFAVRFGFPQSAKEVNEMSNAYVVGHLTVKNAEKWAEYRSRVLATLEPCGAELVFRGKKVAVLAGEHSHSDIVVIRFPDKEAVDKWYSSAAYQSLIPIREQAAEMVLLSYEA
jgi:uncharacterized protein (DUF1330 family)